jgi:hypothetical protein
MELNGLKKTVQRNVSTTSLQAFRLNMWTRDAAKATAWIDDVELTVNGRRLMRVDFDSAGPRTDSNGFQGKLTPLPKPTALP